MHLLDPGEGGWQDRLYCSACRSFQHVPGDAACPYCASTYRNFLATGRLGCAHCYDEFAADLEPLIEKYQAGRTPGASVDAGRAHRYVPDRLAQTRSQEIVRLVLAAGARPDSDLGHQSSESAAEFVESYLSDSQNGRDPGQRRGLLRWRVRVARNIAGLPYRLTTGQQAMLERMLLSGGSSLAAHLPGGLGPVLRGSQLAELQAVGVLPAGARAAAFRGPSPAGPAGADFWAYTGDEDHLRLQWRGRPEPADESTEAALAGRFDAIFQQIERLDELFAFQYHSEYGFLTACPGIGGAGIRVSFLLEAGHLMAAGIWDEYRRRLLESGLELRGERGEDGALSENTPNAANSSGLVQISNRFWPVDVDARAAVLRLLTIVRRIAAADFQERGRGL